MISFETTKAYTDSENGKVGVYLGAVMTYIPTTFNCKHGDTLQLQLNNGHPMVIGVIGRGDETQEQLDTTTEAVDKLDNNIEATDSYCLIASNNQVVQDVVSAKDVNKAKSNGGRQILVSNAAVIVTPPRDIYQDEIATLQ